MAQPADMSPSDTRHALQRARNYIQNMKHHGEAIVERASHGAMATAGGVVAAVLDAKMPVVPGTTFPMKIAVGGLSAAIALADGAGKYSDHLAAFGFGMLSTEAYDVTKKALAAA